MDKIPTGEEFFIQKMFPSGNITKEDAQLWARTNESVQKSIEIAIEFTKLHVKAALESAAEIVLKSGYGRMNEPDNESTITKKMKIFSDEQRGFGEYTYNTTFVDKDSILNAYPETLIK
jgi:hypothetical protein